MEKQGYIRLLKLSRKSFPICEDDVFDSRKGVALFYYGGHYVRVSDLKDGITAD